MEETERRTETRSFSVRTRETEDTLELELDMPEAKADELDVSLSGRKLRIAYEREEEKETVEEGKRIRERLKTTRTREVDLPIDVAEEGVSANLRDGVLRVVLRKVGGTAPRS